MNICLSSTLQMKKYSVFLVLIALVFLFSFDNGDIKKQKKYRYAAHLGCEDKPYNVYSVQGFLNVIKLPLCARDSSGAVFPITKFDMIYAEPGLYQDEEGLPIIVNDYSNAYFTGDTFSKVSIERFESSIHQRDTIYIENVRVRGFDNQIYEGKPLKIIIK